ncbi:hypothetical protein ARMGADRAFT_1168453 [Armillaria gallica]|uniref:Uncharacterized protein n=1 Tax=Armillaria gallica TaxID=47427 RepID=A0A2H3DHI9_ARMGA|nr:hypothetical protein ARMGADRAFT_1168453 [Armillaria gallica]
MDTFINLTVDPEFAPELAFDVPATPPDSYEELAPVPINLEQKPFFNERQIQLSLLLLQIASYLLESSHFDSVHAICLAFSDNPFILSRPFFSRHLYLVVLPEHVNFLYCVRGCQDNTKTTAGVTAIAKQRLKIAICENQSKTTRPNEKPPCATSLLALSTLCQRTSSPVSKSRRRGSAEYGTASKLVSPLKVAAATVVGFQLFPTSLGYLTMDNNRIVNRDVKESCFFDDIPFYYGHNPTAHCAYCTRYFAGYFIDGTFMSSWDPCHDIKLVFTDGACSNNGQFNATAEMGVVMSAAPENQWSIAIDDSADPGALRTSQHAEASELSISHSSKRLVSHGRSLSWLRTLAIYVAEGTTKWFLQWQINRETFCSLRKAYRPPTLSFKLDNIVEDFKQTGFGAGFPKIGQEDNPEVDTFVEAAARINV